MEIKGKTVIVTGAAGTVGGAIVRELLTRQANLVCVDRDLDSLEKLVQELQEEEKILPIQADVTVPADVDRMVAKTLERFGAIDVLMNNAGLLRGVGAMWEADPDLWWRDVEVGVRGSFLCARAVLPHMIERNSGVIVNMVGGGTGTPRTGGSGYGCGKAAIGRLTDTLAAEIGDRWAIRVFGISPGLVRSGLTEFLAESEKAKPWYDYVKEDLEAGREDPPEAAATALCRLIEEFPQKLSGRLFRHDDDFEKILADPDRIIREDLHQTRMRRV